MKKVLITGSTGFIGKKVSSLIESKVCVVRNENAQSFPTSYVIESLDKNTIWAPVLESVESIIHLAGLAHKKSYTVKDYQDINVDGTLHLAREAVKAGVKRFVFVSSIGVHGSSTYNIPFSVESTLNPHNAYSQSKYDAELGLKSIAEETGLEVVIVRPTLVYGPNAPGNFGLLVRLVGRVPFLPFGLVNNKRDFISVQNLADLLRTCSVHPRAAGHTFLASDGKPVSIREFTNTIAEGLNRNLIQLPIPINILNLVGKFLGKSSMIEQLVGNYEVDTSNLKEILGWTPPYTMKQSMYSLSEEL